MEGIIKGLKKSDEKEGNKGVSFSNCTFRENHTIR
jgi:hypothetical protein